jgi:hypothetical protein
VFANFLNGSSRGSERPARKAGQGFPQPCCSAMDGMMVQPK